MTVSLNAMRVVATAALHEWAITDPYRGEWLVECLRRHAAGDWGDLADEDHAANDNAIRTNTGRLQSFYEVPERLTGGNPDSVVWIITDDVEDPDTATTLLFPSDY
jgi:hypothetical protein